MLAIVQPLITTEVPRRRFASNHAVLGVVGVPHALGELIRTMLRIQKLMITYNGTIRALVPPLGAGVAVTVGSTSLAGCRGVLCGNGQTIALGCRIWRKSTLTSPKARPKMRLLERETVSSPERSRFLLHVFGFPMGWMLLLHVPYLCKSAMTLLSARKEVSVMT